MITAGHSPVVHLGLHLLTGEIAKPQYGGRREHLIPVLLPHFEGAQEFDAVPRM